MNFKQFLDFVKKRHAILRDHYGDQLDPQKEILVGVAKVMEESGELADEVLGQMALQRQEKLDKRQQGNLEAEFADVIITSFILAESLGIDPIRALKNKIKEIEKRS